MDMLPHSLLLLVALFTVFLAEVKREEVDGILGSSVLLDPKVKVDHSKSDIIWEFIPAHRSAITILHYIPGIRWEAPSDHFKSRSQYTPSDASLLIKKLERTDQGEYRLTIDDQVVKIIQLNLFDELSEALILANSSSLGSTIQLTCNVSGDAGEYQWWKDGRDISRHHQLIDQNRNLVIPKASRSDCGTYTCVATNRVGHIQTNYTLTIHGFPSLDIAIVGLSIINLVIYLAYVTACQKTKLDKVVKRIKHWLPGLLICNIALLGAILFWITIKSAVLVAGLCSVLFQFLALILPFVVPMLSNRFREKIRLQNLIVCGLQVIVMVISITFLTIVIHQNSCDSSRTTWEVFFTARIGWVVIFILHSVVHHWKGKDTSGNIDTDKGQQDITECQQLKTTTPDDTAGSQPPD